MKINRLESIEHVSVQKNVNKLGKNGSLDNTSESITVSAEAQNTAELRRVRDMVLQSPSIRKDRIEEVKAKMADDPAYFDKAIEKTAENILAYIL